MDSTSRILGRAAGSNVVHDVHGEDATLADVDTKLKGAPPTQKELEHHAHETPREIAARARDGMHVGLVEALELPKRYVDRVASNRTEETDHAAIAVNLRADPAAMAALQSRCDEGRKAAEIMLATRAGAGSFFRNNPGIYEQWENDAAFRAGFDSTVLSVSICGPVRC